MKNQLRIFLVLVFCFSFSIIPFAQESHTGISTTPPKFKKHLAPGAAFAYAVINNRLEVRGQYKAGINFNLNYYTKPWFYWSAEYSYFFPHNSSPGLANIHAWNTELNGNFQMSMAESDLMFKFIFGLSYLNWQGTYVGPDLVDNSSWYYGKLIKQDWVAGNLGVGFSHKIGKQFIGYGDFRFRFATEKKDLISISDTAFLFGLKWEPNFNGKNERGNKQQGGKKSNPKNGSNRHYHWLQKRN
jgi:hypothetical protein